MIKYNLVFWSELPLQPNFSKVLYSINITREEEILESCTSSAWPTVIN